jgi:cbb3-type cytochrome oxidase subunit 1
MRNISARFVTIGLLYALLAMALGISMGVNQDFRNAHLHAHINLVAAVWFVLFALIYKAFPATASTRLAGVHFWLANLGAVIFLPGIYIAQNFDNPLLAIIGSLLTIAAMLVFLINFRRNYEAGAASFSVPGSASSARSPAE